jgi:hypothetical protein
MQQKTWHPTMLSLPDMFSYHLSLVPSTSINPQNLHLDKKLASANVSGSVLVFVFVLTMAFSSTIQFKSQLYRPYFI